MPKEKDVLNSNVGTQSKASLRISRSNKVTEDVHWPFRLCIIMPLALSHRDSASRLSDNNQETDLCQPSLCQPVSTWRVEINTIGADIPWHIGAVAWNQKHRTEFHLNPGIRCLQGTIFRSGVSIAILSSRNAHSFSVWCQRSIRSTRVVIYSPSSMNRTSSVIVSS